MDMDQLETLIHIRASSPGWPVTVRRLIVPPMAPDQ